MAAAQRPAEGSPRPCAAWASADAFFGSTYAEDPEDSAVRFDEWSSGAPGGVDVYFGEWSTKVEV